MNKNLSVYLENIEEINTLMRQKESDIPRDVNLISFICFRSARIYTLLCRNEDLVKTYVLPYLKEDRELTGEEKTDLNEFAESLCSFATPIDPSMAIQIRLKLLQESTKDNSVDEIIAQEYALGIANYLLYSKLEMFASLNVRQYVCPWFEKVTAFYDRFEELSPVSRGYVLRSFNNSSLIFNPKQIDSIDDYMRMIRKTTAVFRNPKVRSLCPEINWRAFENAVNKNCLRLSDAIENGYGLEYVKDLSDAANYLMHNQDNVKTPNEIEQYGAIQLQLILGKIDLEEALRQLDEVYAHHDPHLFNTQGINQNVNIPCFSLLYEEKMEPLNVDRINAKVNAIIQYVDEYRRHGSDHAYYYSVANFIRYYPDNKSIISFRYVLEQLLQSLHMPTYVHSTMVSILSVEIAERLLEEDPGLFIGFEGIETEEEAKERKEEILRFTRYAGLFHDIGKFYCIDVITQYGRKLLDNEFEIIQFHPKCSYEILHAHPSTAPYAETALMHHVSYDRKHGYKKEFNLKEEKYRVITDIIHIADAIDASTDTIGRSYAVCKTQEQIMDELVHAPDFYHPGIMKVLSSKISQEVIERAIQVTRLEIYENCSIPQK